MTRFIPSLTHNRTAFVFCLLLVLVQAAAVFSDDRVIAVVNGENITLSDYSRFVIKTDPVLNPQTVDENMLGKMIEEVVIIQDAAKKGVDVTDKELDKGIADFLKWNNMTSQELEKSILEQGMSSRDYRKLFRNGMIKKKHIDREVDAMVAVSDEDILNYYNRNREMFIQEPEVLQVRAIFIKLDDNMTPEEISNLHNKALKTYSDIKEGAPFENMADRYNSDSSRSEGGVLGSFKRGELVAELDRALALMKDGDVSEPVIAKEGIYILKLVKRSQETLVPPGQVKERITTTLFRKKRDERYAEWLKSLMDNSSVKLGLTGDTVKTTDAGRGGSEDVLRQTEEKLGEALKRLSEKNDALNRLNSEYRELSRSYDVLSRQYEIVSAETKSLKGRLSRYEVPLVKIAGKTYTKLDVIEENIIASRVLARINAISPPWRSGNPYEDFIIEQVLFSKIREEDIREKNASIIIPAKNYSFDNREQEYLAKYLLISYLVGQTTAEPKVDEDEIKKYYEENKREYLIGPAEKVVKYLFIPYTKEDETEKSLLAADMQREAVNGKSLENIYKAWPEKVLFKQSPPDELPAAVKGVGMGLSDGEIKKIITDDQYIIVQVQIKGPFYRKLEDVSGEIREKLASGTRVPLSLWLRELRKEAEEIRR